MKNSENSFFAYNLKWLLDKNGIRKVDLAKRLGVSKSAISNYLAGVSIPKRDVFNKIVSYFHVSTEVLVKDNLDKPATVFKEDGKPSFVVPFFNNQLIDDDIIYRNDNYQGTIYSPIPMPDKECYAVMVYDNAMASRGIAKGNIAIYAATKAVADGEIAAVFLRKKRSIIIRSVSVTDKKITLTSDENSETFKRTAKSCDVVILGKVIYATFNPNK